MANGAKIAVTWIELILVLLLIAGGLASWKASRQGAEKLFESPEPEEEDFERRYHVSKLQRRLAAVEEEWKATLALAQRQHLEIEQQTAQMEALARVFAASQTDGSTEPRLIYLKARDQKAVAERLVVRLERRLHAIEQRLTRSAEAVAAARQAAAAALEEARAERSRDRRAHLALASSAGVVVFFLGVLAVLSGRAAQHARIRRGPILAVTAGALVILILYEALGALALSLGSLIALFAVRALFLAGPGET